MLYEFFHWWFTQLNSLVPSNFKRYWQQAACTLYIDVSPQTLTIQAHTRQKKITFGQLNIHEANNSQNPKLAKFLQDLPCQPERLILRIDAKSYLLRDVELPLAAEENLQQTIGFQLEQLIPFPTDQAVNFSGIKQRLPAEKKLLAWLASMPQQTIQQATTLLGYHTTTLLQAPHTAPRHGEALELHYQIPNNIPWWSLKNIGVLSLLVCACLAGAFTLHIQNRHASYAYMQAQLNPVKAQAKQATQLQQLLKTRQTQTQQLAKHKAKNIRFMDLWSDITQRLNNDTWVYQLDMRDNALYLQGTSNNASALIQQLEASPYLQEVHFIASVTREPRSDQERFNISARLHQPVEQP